MARCISVAHEVPAFYCSDGRVTQSLPSRSLFVQNESDHCSDAKRRYAEQSRSQILILPTAEPEYVIRRMVPSIPNKPRSSNAIQGASSWRDSVRFSGDHVLQGQLLWAMDCTQRSCFCRHVSHCLVPRYVAKSTILYVLVFCVPITSTR